MKPKPIAMKATPTPALKRGVEVIFSIVMTMPSAAIHTMFMVPTANISSIIAQQQPRQCIPCRRPRRNTPRGSVVQLAKKNGNGRWHSVRQACLSAEN